MTHDNTSPQVEDGHTRLANELLEAMCLAGFSARQWAVVMAVVRKTYGYGKKGDDIGLGQLEQMTGIDKGNLSRVVRELADARVITRTEGMFGHKLGVNKRYAQWRLKGATRGVAKLATGGHETGLPVQQPRLPIQQPQMDDSGIAESTMGVASLATAVGVVDLAAGVVDLATVADSAKLGLSNRQPQKETLQKKEKHPPIPPKGEEGDPEGFAEAWAAYPKRQGGNPRGTAVKAWRARLRSSVTATEMIAGVHGYAAHCRAEGKVGTSFVMMAATFFGPDLRFRDFAESPARPGPQGASRSAGVVPGSPLDIDTNPAWLAQTGYASVWEAISDGCTEHTYRQFRDGKRIPKEAA